MKNVARFRKLIKKILRTICIWGVIAMLLLPTMAVDELETIPLHPYITMRWSGETSTTAQVRASDSLNFTTIYDGNSEQYKAIYQYQSALDKNTFYHIRVKQKADSTNSRRWLENITTGIITQQGGEVELLMQPATTLAPYLQTINEATNEVKTISYSYENAMLYKVRSYVGVKAYYYFTNNGNNEYTIDAIMYFNDEFFDYGWNFDASATRYMQCYLGIAFPTVGRSIVESFDVYPIGGSDYNGKLDQIIALLQTQGRGLTEEDIKQATVEALRQHEQEEQQQAQQGTTDAQAQAEQAMARYTAVMEQMKTAMQGIEDIKNIDTSTYTLTIGPFTNPMTGGVFPAVGVDFYSAYQGMPTILKTTCPIVVTFFVLMAYAREFLDIFKHVEKTMHGEDEQ